MCMRVCLHQSWSDVFVFANHGRMLWTSSCWLHAGQCWHGFLTASEPITGSSPPSLSSLHPSYMTNMGLLNRLLFILLHDWNYMSFMYDIVSLTHPQRCLWCFYCLWEKVSESVCLKFLLFFCSFCSVDSLCSRLSFAFVTATIHLDVQNWLRLAICHPSPAPVLPGILSDLLLKRKNSGFQCSPLEVSSLQGNSELCYSWPVTAHPWVRIQDTRTAGLPVQYEESPMCLLGVSQLSCMWGGRPPAWAVH